MTDDRHYLESELDQLLQTGTDVWSFLLGDALDGVWFWDLENPDQEYMSPEFWRLFGVDPASKKHLASEWKDMIFPEDIALVTENLERHLADPSHPYDLTLRYNHVDGGVVWVRCRGFAIRNDSGKPVRLMGVHTDISAQKREEQKVSIAQAEMETIFDTASNAIIAFDENGMVVRVNMRARHILGGISSPIPFAWPDAVQFLDSETMQPLENSADPMRRALAGLEVRNETHLMRRVQSGEDRRYVRVDFASVEAKGSQVRLVAILDDVSEQERNRQVVERQSRLDALGQLTGGIAHDFNNLLAAMLYAVDLARGEPSELARNAYLETALDSVKRGRDLTSRLLAFARRQPGLASAKRTDEVFDEFEKLVRPMLESSIEINFDVQDEDLMQFCDQPQLETALMNLVLNARDAILRSGKGNRIDVVARSVRSPSDPMDGSRPRSGLAASITTDQSTPYRCVEINVRDNGPGMDEETLIRCTDPFFTTKTSTSGSGLGLAMVYGFARQASGDLRVYSEVDVGTNVQLTLPRATAAGIKEPALWDDPFAKGEGQRILIVEDEPMLLSIVEDVIEKIGYNAVTATSGREALAVLQANIEVDLLLTDVVMPGGVGGFELAQKARELRPNLPVIYTSGYTGYTVAEMGKVQAPLLQKPTPRNILADAIANSLAEAKE